MKYVYTICYNTLDVWENKQDAIEFYTECFYNSEGCEHERYANILADLHFVNIGRDRVDNIVWKIRFMIKNKLGKIDVEHQDYMDAIKKVEEW